MDSFDDEGAAGPGAGAGGVLAKGFGPSAVAVAFFDLADEANFAGGGDFFLESAEVRSL